MIRGETSFTHEIAGAQQRDGRFLTLFGDHTQPNPPLLDVEDRVGTFSLGENGLLRAIAKNRSAHASTPQKGFRIEKLDLFVGGSLCRYAATRSHKKLR
jgi:hypothetical protein